MKYILVVWSVHTIRPGKVDSLFPINYFLDFEVGRWSLFIIDCAEVNVFFWQNTTSIPESHANNMAWHIESGRALVDAGGDGKQGIYFAWP